MPEIQREPVGRGRFIEACLVEAVLILGQLAVRHPAVRLSNSETLAMQQELFEVLEKLNDLRIKVSGDG